MSLETSHAFQKNYWQVRCYCLVHVSFTNYIHKLHSQITKNILLIWIRQECNNFRFKVIFTTYLESFCQDLSTTVSNIIGTQVQ